jgi:hypothetical protein
MPMTARTVYEVDQDGGPKQDLCTNPDNCSELYVRVDQSSVDSTTEDGELRKQVCSRLVSRVPKMSLRSHPHSTWYPGRYWL